MARLQNLTIPNVTLPTGNRKISEWDLITRDDFRYHSHQRVRVNGIAGTLFTSDTITDAMRALREQHSNVLILAGHSQYAPEVTKGYVFVADKGMKA